MNAPQTHIKPLQATVSFCETACALFMENHQ